VGVNVNLRVNGVLSAVAEFDNRNTLMNQYFNGTDSLGVIPIPDGASDFPNKAATIIWEIESQITPVIPGNTFRLEKFVSRRYWEVMYTDGTKTKGEALKLVGEDMDNVPDGPIADARDTTPSATRRIYNADNPRCNLEFFVNRLDVGEALVMKLSFRENVYMTFNGVEKKMASIQIKQTQMVRRVNNTGNYANDWQLVGTNQAAVGSQPLVITKAEAQAAMGPTPVEDIDQNQNKPDLTIP